MWIRRLLAAGAVIAALAISFELGRAQPLFPTSLNGLETWVAAIGGPQGTSIFVNTSMMRNAGAITTVSGTGAHTTAMTTQQSTLVWSGPAPTTWVITLPARPFDGQIARVGTGTALSSVTVNPAPGNLIAAAFAGQAIAVGSSVDFQYAQSSNTWYRLH